MEHRGEAVVCTEDAGLELEQAPTWVRVVARPLIVAREEPYHTGRPIAPFPEGAVLEVKE